MKKAALLLLFFAAAMSAQTATTHYVTLTWTPSSDATPTATYNLYRGTAAGGEASVPVNTLPIGLGCTATAGTCTYTDANVVAGQTYYYVLKMLISGTEVASSNEAKATIPFAGPTLSITVK